MIPALILAVAVLALGGVLLLHVRALRRELEAHSADERVARASVEGELAIDRVALQGALERLADGLEAARRADLVGKRVTVHTTNGESIRGVVLAELEDGGLELQAARYLQPDGSELEADGRVRITGARRSWLQIVEG